jgi:hypothetical protein
MDMITFRNAANCPEAFLEVFGCTVEDFEGLYVDFAAAYGRRVRESIRTRKGGSPRRRKPGAGPRFKHSLQDRLLMALFWRRVRPTLKLLGYFFGLDKTSAEDNLKDMLETLETVTFPPLEPPGPDRGKLRTPEGAMSAFPGLARLIEEEKGG